MALKHRKERSRTELRVLVSRGEYCGVPRTLQEWGKGG